MNYSKKWKSSLQTYTNKIRQNREASLYCQQCQHHHSLINILTKYSVVTRYELQISAKTKSQIEQKSIVINSCCQSTG